ncbi:pyruvate formate lyase family protein [Sphingobacterium faecium]|uniref:pyruvate formate lyase family protein n=1 Tax=Sphingobacterium faecium TaxID=34087 RepID=UPI0024685278|nr:pyruvate formate lyase family protein [Sphingobacterium faecium]MDH5826251.1 pyruvate formate lyase family protein [Sphingobacterium faecium]
MKRKTEENHFVTKYKHVWNKTQPGIIYPATSAIYITVKLKNQRDIIWNETFNEIQLLRQAIEQRYFQLTATDATQLISPSTTLGFSLEQWSNYCSTQNQQTPLGFDYSFPSDREAHSSKVFEDTATYINSFADIWLHIKFNGDGEDQLSDSFLQLAKDTFDKLWGADNYAIYTQYAHSKSNELDGYKGKVLGCRFVENVNNPTDPISIAKNMLIGPEGNDSFGGSYVLAQRFSINWNKINELSEEEINYLVGRNNDNNILPDAQQSSHIKSSRVQDENGLTTEIYRLGLPFGRANTDNSILFTKNLNSIPLSSSDEAGIYFAGYARSASILERVVANQSGYHTGFVQDKLLAMMQSDLGGIYYIPSLKECLPSSSILQNSLAAATSLESPSDFNYSFYKSGTENIPSPLTSPVQVEVLAEENFAQIPLKSFQHKNQVPQQYIDWSRIDRHYKDKSDNGFMYYNSKNFLFTHATRNPGEMPDVPVISLRILSLLQHSFSSWQDNWYYDRKQQEIGHLFDYLNDFQESDRPAAIVSSSIMIRKAWAIRMSLKLFATESYGFKGRRIVKEDGSWLPYNTYNLPLGKVINGADTYRIYPEEIIVGCMPNLTLGEGSYLMSYLTETERQDANIKGLSEASGVGHVIPDFEQILDKGLDVCIETLSLSNSEINTASVIAFKGMQDYCLSYADLAIKMSKGANLTAFEQYNLEQIHERMEHLAHGKARNFLEAVQLLYIVHLSLHLTGEPTALGRLDQVLYKYYLASKITEEEAQEIIDAFFIKLDEKVQQNRLMMEDHQYYGNMAMGGSSGPYPQGASLGQWIQQLTVGGCKVNNKKGSIEGAYNELTTFFIRSSGRLPLNAPCLSLRTTKDIPDHIIKEAAQALLSGGAHPIFLNDEKIIEGLYHSGDDIGGDKLQQHPKWKSTVSYEAAQNYACDGCYEPQFPSENWFSLGGFSALQPLECAINSGKTYGAAGESFLYGKRVSLRSKNANEITNFNELVDLYFQHFDFINRKNFIGQLSSYGANTEYCPSPLLNALMKGCLEKDQDFYSGGTKYNIYAPCYIGVSSVINSLYAIKQLVYDKNNAITTLEELLICLCCNWGEDLKEPFISQLGGQGRREAIAERFRRLRNATLNLPKFGRGHQDVDQLGESIILRLAQTATECFTKPWPQFEEQLVQMAEKFGTQKHQFGIQFQPGVGTFENYYEMGAWNAASADGRLNGTAIESDLSPTPWPSDLGINPQRSTLLNTLSSYSGALGHVFSDGAPIDLRIEEGFELDTLQDCIKAFSQGEGSNILTITTANQSNMIAALNHPEQFDLLRVRTGGWTNFFVSMFPKVQNQQIQRPIESAGPIDRFAGDILQCPYHNKIKY